MVDILYSVTSFTCALVTFLIAVRTMNIYDRKNILDRTSCVLELWVGVFCIIDALWGLIASDIICNENALVIISTMFHLFAAITAALWLNYILVYLGYNSRQALKYRLTALFLISIQIILLIDNIFSHKMFYSTDDGFYVATSFRKILFYLQFTTYIFIALISVISILHEKETVFKRKYYAVLSFVMSPVICGILQMIYPFWPFYSIGFMFGCCIIFTFVVSDFVEKRNIEKAEERAIQYQRALKKSSKGFFEINLSQNKVINEIIHIENDISEIQDVSEPKQLEDYDMYMSGWAERNIASDINEFKKNSSTDFLISCFRNGKSSHDMYCREKKADGSISEMKATFYMSKDDSSNDIMALCLVFDITEEIETKKKIQEQEQNIQKYYKIIDGLASDYQNIYEVNLSTDSLVVYKMSDRITGMFGDSFKKLKYSEAAEKYLESAVLPSSQDEMRENLSVGSIRKNLENIKSFSKIYLNNNSEYTEMKVVKVPKSDDDVIMGFGVKDAEIRKEKQDDLATQRGYEVIDALSQSFDYVCYVDIVNNEITRYFANDVISGIIEGIDKNLPSKYRLDTLFRKIIPTEEIDSFLKKVDREKCMKLIRMNKTHYVNFNAVINGKSHYYALKMALDKRDSSGVILGLLCTDDEMQHQMELQTAKTNAELANNAKTNFLFNMSHDIRTPLNAITGYTSIAKKYSNDAEKVRCYLGKIDLASHQLLALVNQVLDMSRIESGRIVLEENPVDITEKANAMFSITTVNAQLKGIDFSLEFEHIKNKYVYTDASRIDQLITNILGNAVKYTPEGGSVVYTVKELKSHKKGWARYSFKIKDTGIGMSHEYQKHIFEPFSREKNTTASGIQGTGLGMSIVQKIVTLLNGTIEIDSEPGKGTCITVIVPMKIQKNPPSKNDSIIPCKTRMLKGKRILLVEDNEMNREIAKDLLEDYGFVIEEAENGNIAIDKIIQKESADKQHYYDYVLMDIQMPVMNGYEAARKIRSLNIPWCSKIPIIAMTANAFEEDRKLSFESGMNEHVSKPINIQKLNETLELFANQG